MKETHSICSFLVTTMPDLLEVVSARLYRCIILFYILFGCTKKREKNLQFFLKNFALIGMMGDSGWGKVYG